MEKTTHITIVETAHKSRFIAIVLKPFFFIILLISNYLYSILSCLPRAFSPAAKLFL